MPFVGLEECARRLDEKGRDSWQEIKTAFWSGECVEIIREAMYLCPVDTGELMGTIPIVSHLEETPTTATAIIGAGTDYGVYVHEDLTKYHKAPTRAKFIEVPVMQRAHDIPMNIAKRLGYGGYEAADVSGMLVI